MSTGSSPGTSLKYPLEPLQNDPSMEEILMDQVNALKKTIQDREFEHTRRVETLIEALSDKAEENIQILNELEAVKEKMREMEAAEKKAAIAAAAEAAAENDGNGDGAQLLSPQLPVAGDPIPLSNSGEISLPKPGEQAVNAGNDAKNNDGNGNAEHEAALEKLRRELEEEREKTKRLEDSVKEYEKKIAALEDKLKSRHKKRLLKKLKGDSGDDNDEPEDDVPTYEYEDSESENWIVVCEKSDSNSTASTITNNNGNGNNTDNNSSNDNGTANENNTENASANSNDNSNEGGEN